MSKPKDGRPVYNAARTHKVWLDAAGNLMAQNCADGFTFVLMDRAAWEAWHRGLPRKDWTPLSRYAESAPEQEACAR